MVSSTIINEPKKEAMNIDPGEEIVISGIAGRFPESDNMLQFQKNLLNKTDLITADHRRWKLDNSEIPVRAGKINNINMFDAEFFGMNFKEAHSMDPMSRMLLEHAFEAIVDAGCNPEHLRGTNTGVFIGSSYSESENFWVYSGVEADGLGITGCSKGLFANRISYCLGVHGPSYNVDTACSSGLMAMHQAYRAIRGGLCDTAIVGGANLCLHPYLSLQFARLGVLSPEGKCKSFDTEANGYVRSETAAVVFLQKAKDAKRIYATLVHAKTNSDGYKEEGITFPSTDMQYQLLAECYQECGIPPTSLSYIEAHGTGTKVGDPEEVNALDKIFCKDRTTPLKIGSIKSNLGHSEPASGFCSIAKVILAMESGILTPNLHFRKARDELVGIRDGRLQVVTEPTPWEGGYVGINSFGLGGSNCHILLKSQIKEKKNKCAPNDDLPRLIVVSGRHEEAVATLLNDVESRPVDVEYVKLLQDLFSDNIPGHLCRGYTILQPRGITKKHVRDIQHCSWRKRPVSFVFTGLGSQWATMGTALLQLPVFATAIKKCDTALKPYGIDIFDILKNKDKKTFDNVQNSLIGVVAIQIGLIDLLTTVGIVPDIIIGHSIGELGCAYVDGCLTAEQTILAAYTIGKISLEANLIRTSSAVVNLGHRDLKNKCPTGIDITAHNDIKNTTICGPEESIKNFLNKLKANNVSVTEVQSGNIPYHSQYINSMKTRLLKNLEGIISKPKQRSSKWLCSSIPQSDWKKASAQLSSAEYLMNNLLNTVLFEETCAFMPTDAVVIEIAPQALLHNIFRIRFNSGITHLTLMQCEHVNNVEVFLQGLGKLYIAGSQMQLMNLYPKVQYPVSRGTPMISPNIKWDHSQNWYVSAYKLVEKLDSGERRIQVSLVDEKYEFMAGHVIDARNLLPATGYLQLIWETLAMMRGELYTEVPVVFEDVKFLRATNISKTGVVNLLLTIQKGTGRFEIIDGDAAVVTGYVRHTSNPTEERMNVSFKEEKFMCQEPLTSKDVYKEMRLRGYQYSGMFCAIKRASLTGTKGHIAWSDNWVAFIDNLLQINIVGVDARSLMLPTAIKKLVIDTKVHQKQIREMTTDEKEFPVYVDTDLDCIVAGGVEIQGLKAGFINRRKVTEIPILEEHRFVAHMDRAAVTLKHFVQIAYDLGLENHSGVKVKTVEVIDESDDLQTEDIMSICVHEYLANVPLIQSDATILTSGKVGEYNLPQSITIMDLKKFKNDSKIQFGIGRRLLTKERSEHFEQLLGAVNEGGFIITRETIDSPDTKVITRNCNVQVIMEKICGKELLILLRKKNKIPINPLIIHVNNTKFTWVPEVQEAIKMITEGNCKNNLILLVGSGDIECGLLGLLTCLRREPGSELIRGLLILDSKAPPFSLTNPFYANQLGLNLAINVLGENGMWGTYRHLPLRSQELIPVHRATINQLTWGDLSTLNWLEQRDSPEIKTGIRVFCSSINFRDVMVATGKLAVEVFEKNRMAQDCVIGLEYSGIDSNGRRVMGFVQSGGMSNIIYADDSLSWEIPDNWTFEDAATVPVAYATCYCAFYFYGNLKKGDKILIHAGSGGVGQAAINLALHQGCEVFTTVGTPEKRRFILEKFPAIPASHIGNSRDTSFEQLIMQETHGRGVDVVLNSLAEEKLQASIRCLAKGGRFLEIGKFDLVANNTLGMEIFQKEISVHGVMLDKMNDAEPEKRLRLQNMVKDGVSNGAVKPLTKIVFSKDEVEKAFRYMAAGKHIGKCIIKVRSEGESINEPILAYPRYYCLRNHSYVIFGGLGGFGLELADWLVLRGAENIVIVSRQGIKDGYQKMRVELWKSYGVKVVIVSGRDASQTQDCEFILKTASKLGPVDGIFNLAVALSDCLYTNQTQKTFEDCFRPKAGITKQLDIISRKVCPDLRHFVMFSSVSCGRGNAGQTNYGMANSVMERICERRAAEGLPALAIQWSAIGDVGLVSEMNVGDKEVVILGMLQQRISSCLQVLNNFLLQKHPVVSSYIPAAKRSLSDKDTSIVGTVLNIMSLKSLKAISHQAPLTEFGMDSMMAVEIKQTLECDFDIFLTAQDIRNLNFAKLLEIEAIYNNNESGVQASVKDESLMGMKLIMRNIGFEKISNETCIKVETKQETGRDEVFLIPGIEGYASVYSSIAPLIASPCSCMQFGINVLKNVPAIAQELLPHILTKIQDLKKFIITGYSFGSLVAIELARKLEALGFSGRLILIDGSPEQMKALIKQQLASKTDDELQTNILLGFMDILLPNQSSNLLLDLETCKGWEKKLDAYIARVRPNMKEEIKADENTHRSLCTAIYHRILAIDEYDISRLPPIRAPITLLKPTIPSTTISQEDFGLGKVTSGKVDVHYVEGNHETILDNSKVGAAIDGDPIKDAEASI